MFPESGSKFVPMLLVFKDCSTGCISLNKNVVTLDNPCTSAAFPTLSQNLLVQW